MILRVADCKSLAVTFQCYPTAISEGLLLETAPGALTAYNWSGDEHALATTSSITMHDASPIARDLHAFF